VESKAPLGTSRAFPKANESVNLFLEKGSLKKRHCNNKKQRFPVCFPPVSKEKLDKKRLFTFSRLQFLEDELRRA